MRILLTNDDGPPSNQSSPYVHSLIETLQKAGHTVSVVLPHRQRSWIGKAHLVGQTLTPTYFRPGTLHKDEGLTQDHPFEDGGEEWILLDGTPASCVQIGLCHLFDDRGPFDVLVSGPNYGRNTTAVFALSSGTLGAAMEGATMGMKSIAISYAFDSRDHDHAIIAAASKVSTKLIEKFVAEWPDDVHVYSINVPLKPGVEDQRIVYADMIQNQWTSGSTFKLLKDGAGDADPNLEESKIRNSAQHNGTVEKSTYRERVSFKWAPHFADVKAASAAAGAGDGWHVLQGHVTVTPLRANFWHLPHYTGDIKLNEALSISADNKGPKPLAVVQYPEPYVQPLVVKAVAEYRPQMFEIVQDNIPALKSDRPTLQFRAYEDLEFEHAMNHTTSSQVCAYVIRKALIRKHFLSHTIATWLTKRPNSMLKDHFKPSIHFELDYAEFLDDALVDAWDLHESMTRNQENQEQQDSRNKEWWILKPGMSDGGNGIRLFSSLQELQAIFEQWDPENDQANDEEAEPEPYTNMAARADADEDGTLMTSHLRHFVVQPYIEHPLLLSSCNNHKFHVRAYVLAVGALKVFVYREMLALFAAQTYVAPAASDTDGSLNLAAHLTNTCFQRDSTKHSSVRRFWSLDEPSLSPGWREDIFKQICEATGEVFEAAAREQIVHFQPLPNAFELFGVDFLVDSDCNVWLLELNAYPDFKQTGDSLREVVVGGLFADVVKTAVAPFFGSKEFERGTPNMVLAREIDLGRR